MGPRKSNEMSSVGRILRPSLSPDSLENRGWWKGIHDELISFMSKPRSVHQLAKRIVHFANRTLKRSPSSETESSCASPRNPHRMAEPRVEKITKNTACQGDNDFYEENAVLQEASPCGMKRKRRKTPLRPIQPIIGLSLKPPRTGSRPPSPSSCSSDDGFEAYGHHVQQCYVVLENFPQVCGRRSRVVKATDDVDSQEAEDESNSNPQKTEQSVSSENNEAAANGNIDAVPRRAEHQDPKRSVGVTPEPRKPRRRTVMKREPESSDDETYEAFGEIFTKRRNCETLESDTEEFWAELRRFRSAVDYETEARELLGLDADFSTPIVRDQSPVASSDVSPSAASQRRQGRRSSLATPNNSQPGRRRSSAGNRSSLGDATPRGVQKTPKWQQTKEVVVKVSRSGRVIKPPVDDSFV